MDNGNFNQQGQQMMNQYGQYGNMGMNMNGNGRGNKNKTKGIILGLIIAVLVCCCGFAGTLAFVFGQAFKEKAELSALGFGQALEDAGFDNSNGTLDISGDDFASYSDDNYYTSAYYSKYSVVSAAESYTDNVKSIYSYDDADSNSSINGVNFTYLKWHVNSMYYGVLRVEDVVVFIESEYKTDRDDLMEALDKATQK